MPTLREIRRRIAGVKNTQKITKAMKMVAAAKLRRAQDAIISARPYARKIKELLQNLSANNQDFSNPFFAQREVKNVILVVVTSDRGLCGAFSSNIIRTTRQQINRYYSDPGCNLRLITVGKKGYDYFVKKEIKIESKHIGIFSHLDFRIAKNIITEISNSFLKGKCDKIEVIYNEFKTVAQQRIVIEQLLPIPLESIQSKDSNPADYIYEPSSKKIVDSLIPKHLNFQMWRILLESNAAEQGSRMTAMENATINANDLIRNLQLVYNKARQASITKELLEIVGGAEALKKTG
ncbi:MAG: ATP synthase F1 subunit gamma [Bacteroidota bacterium]|nr:ATP synthase F1 subunit gamma [Bacteroidota bacterium]